MQKCYVKQSKKNERNVKNCGKGVNRVCQTKRKIYKVVNKRAEKYDCVKYNKVDGNRK
jgi:hypothetical protein